MSDRREQVAESPRLGYGMSVTDPGVGRSAFVRETNQSRLVCAIRKLIICRTVATAPHVYARRAPSFWSSAVVKASVTCRVWAITSSRTALRSFSVRPSGAQASTSSILLCNVGHDFGGEGFAEFQFFEVVVGVHKGIYSLWDGLGGIPDGGRRSEGGGRRGSQRFTGCPARSDTGAVVRFGMAGWWFGSSRRIFS